MFGQAIDGLEVIKEIENVTTDKDAKPSVDVIIANCGELIPQIVPKGNQYMNV